MSRESKIEFRVSALEKKAIELTAQEVGMSVSDYCRKSALGKDVKMRFTDEQLLVYKDLHQYHTNFSRIAQLIRAKGYTTPLLQEIEEVTKLIRQHLKGFES